MTAILVALFCLKGVCFLEVIPTPIAFDMEACEHLNFKPTHGQWRFTAWECHDGRSV